MVSGGDTVTVGEALLICEWYGADVYFCPVRRVEIAIPEGAIIVNPYYVTACQLVHELGHIQRGKYYDRNSSEATIDKAEAKANRWALPLMCSLIDIVS